MKTGSKIALAAFALALGCTVLWFSRAEAVALPANRTLFVLTWGTAVALALFSFFRGVNWYGGIAAVGAIVIGCFLPFTVSISAQEVASDSVQIGDVMPNFAGPTDTGEIFDSAALRGKPVLIKFFRAHW
jgi:cytochrome oxidase Cu insertion factor (SCO1/SenC/PrrC family)